MKRYLICIVIGSLALATGGCARKGARHGGPGGIDNMNTKVIPLPADDTAIEIVLAEMFNEEDDQLIPQREIFNNVGIKKYSYTWGSSPLYLDKRSNTLITNHPTFLITSKDENVSLKSFEVWGAFRLKEYNRDCDSTGLTFIPLSLDKGRGDTFFLSLNSSTGGEELTNVELMKPRLWCAFLEIKNKQGEKLNKSWEFSVTLLENRLQFKLGRTVWDDKERVFKADQTTETEASKRRIYRADLQKTFPYLSNTPALNAINIPDPEKAISVLEVENRHYAPFLVELPASNRNNLSYSLRVLESNLIEDKLQGSNQPVETTNLKKYGEVKDIPVLLSDVVFTRADNGEELKAEQRKDGSIYFVMPGRNIGEAPLEVNVEFLTRFNTPANAFDSRLLDVETLDTKKSYLGHLQFLVKQDLVFKYKPVNGAGDWMSHNEKINGVLDVASFLRRK